MGRKQGKGDLPVNETQGKAEKTDGQKHHVAALLRSGAASVRRAVHGERDELVCPRVSRRTLFCHGKTGERLL